jgi:hypothetical protein
VMMLGPKESHHFFVPDQMLSLFFVLKRYLI